MLRSGRLAALTVAAVTAATGAAGGQANSEAGEGSRVVVQARGGICRPEPTVTWFAADGSELASAAVPSGGIRLSGFRNDARPAYLLADCRGYYVAGWKFDGEVSASYRIVLDRAVPPRQMGHDDGVRVLVQDGERDAPLPRALVYWVYEDGQESEPSITDAQGRALLTRPTASRPPRFLLVDASERGFQITGQAYRLYFDEYTIVLRPASF